MFLDSFSLFLSMRRSLALTDGGSSAQDDAWSLLLLLPEKRESEFFLVVSPDDVGGTHTRVERSRVKTLPDVYQA